MAKRTIQDALTGEVLEISVGESFFMVRDTYDMPWLNLGLSVSEMKVFLKLSSIATKKGFVSVAKGARSLLAASLEMTERSVADSIKRLASKNLIADLGGNLYMINPEVAFKTSSDRIDKMIDSYYTRKKNARNEIINDKEE